jgi:hypothetical protein
MNRAALAAALLLGGCAGSSDVDVFNDPSRPYPDRLAALLALRNGADRAAFDAVRPALEAEAARASGLSTMSDAEERGCAEALEWLAERADGAAPYLMELYLDRTRRPPERVRVAAARGLGRYPKEPWAAAALWDALRDPKELASVRSAALRSLRAFLPPDELRTKVKSAPSASDPWLQSLQNRLE